MNQEWRVFMSSIEKSFALLLHQVQHSYWFQVFYLKSSNTSSPLSFHSLAPFLYLHIPKHWLSILHHYFPDKSNSAPLFKILHFRLCFLVLHNWTLLMPATENTASPAASVLTPVSFLLFLVSSLPPEIPIPSYSPLTSPHQLLNFCFSLLFKPAETWIYQVCVLLATILRTASPPPHAILDALLLRGVREFLNLGSFAVIHTFLSFLNNF